MNAASPGMLVTGAVALGCMLLLASLAWALSVRLRDASIVDSFWAMFIAVAGLVYAWHAPLLSTRMELMLALTLIWMLRLSIYLSWRSHGQPEDRRYQAIRARNQPHFPFKSLYLVFWLQATLAWIVALPLLAAASSDAPLTLLDVLGLLIFSAGLLIETIADQQLARFRAHAGNAHQVMDRGLWRYSRHPNYFGECCVWWGLFIMALAAGGWWSVFSPLLMTVLLLKVSGVTLLEADMNARRPAYRDYVLRTNAFFPGPQRRSS